MPSTDGNISIRRDTVGLLETLRRYISYTFPKDVKTYEAFVSCLRTSTYTKVEIHRVRDYDSNIEKPFQRVVAEPTGISWGAVVTAYGENGAIKFAPIYVPKEENLKLGYSASRAECNLQIDLLSNKLRYEFPRVEILVEHFDTMTTQKMIDQRK